MTAYASSLSNGGTNVISTSTSALTFDSADAASAFSSAVGGGGATVRISDGSNAFDLALGSYGSGTSITVSSSTQQAGSSTVSMSSVNSSGSIKAITSTAASGASAFHSAAGGSGGIVRFAGSSDTIDVTLSSYSSGASVSVSSAVAVKGTSGVSMSGLSSMKVVSTSGSQANTNAASFASTVGGSGTVIRIADASTNAIQFTLGSTSSNSIALSAAVQWKGSSGVTMANLQSGAISSLAANASNATAFQSAAGPAAPALGG